MLTRSLSLSAQNRAQLGTLLNYSQRLQKAFGSSLIAHWPLQETSGNIAQAYGAVPVNTNYFPNPALDSVNHGWISGSGNTTITKTTVPEEIHSGINALKVTASAGGFAAVYKDIFLSPNEKYKLRFWIKGDGVSIPRYSITARKDSSYIIPLTLLSVSGSYLFYETAEFTNPSDNYRIQVLIRTTAASQYFIVDDVELIKMTSYSINDLNGFYYKATLGQEGIKAGQKSVYFDGSVGSGIPLSSLVCNEFPLNNEGTLMIWMKPDVSVLTDGVARFSIKFKTNPSSPVACYSDISKTSSNNLSFQFRDGVIAEANHQQALTESKWYMMAQTWSKEDGLKRYIDGVQVGATISINNGNWTDVFDGTRATIGAEDILMGSGNWKGWLSHAAIGKSALTASQIVSLSNP